MQTQSDKRFLNFPLVMLGDTITNPRDGLDKILNYAIVEYSPHCRRTWQQAFAQIIYCKYRKKGVNFSAKVNKLFRRDDVEAFLEGGYEGGNVLDECFAMMGHNAPDGVNNQMIESINDSGVEFNDQEQKAIVDCMAMIDAGHYLGFTLGNIDAVQEGARKARLELLAFQREHGHDASASIPVKYFQDTWNVVQKPDNEQNIITEMRLFRMVAAVRSLIGGKALTGTTKDMLRARCIGGKSPKVASAILKKSPALIKESSELESRWKFDKVLNEGGTRGFYTSVGMYRRIFLSTENNAVEKMVEGIVKTHTVKKAVYANKQQAIRQAVRDKVESLTKPAAHSHHDSQSTSRSTNT